MSDELPLADASRRLRDVPGFPRRPGRPRKHVANGHVSGQAEHAVSQPRVVPSENRHSESAGVRQAPVVAIERQAGAVVTVAPALLSLTDAGRYLGGLSVRVVQTYITSGLLTPVHLPATRGGRHLSRVLLERGELDALVARSKDRA